jgi:hypothetical protein
MTYLFNSGDRDMAQINVHFYGTSRGKQQASILVGQMPCVYMSKTKALKWLADEEYTVGPHTPEVRYRLGRLSADELTRIQQVMGPI